MSGNKKTDRSSSSEDEKNENNGKERISYKKDNPFDQAKPFSFSVNMNHSESSPSVPTKENFRTLSAYAHELSVYQAELSMQNQELRETQQALLSSRDRYYKLFDLAPVALIITDLEGVIQEANSKSISLFGGEEAYLIQKPLLLRISPPFRTVFVAYLKKIKKAVEQKQNTGHFFTPAGNSPAKRRISGSAGIKRQTAKDADKEALPFSPVEVKAISKGISHPGNLLDLVLEITPIQWDMNIRPGTKNHEQSLLCAFVDITQTRRMEEKLEKFFQLSRDIMCIFENGKPVFANPAFYEHFIDTSWPGETRPFYLREREKQKMSLDFLSNFSLLHLTDPSSRQDIISVCMNRNPEIPYIRKRILCKSKNKPRVWMDWSAIYDEQTGRNYVAARDVDETVHLEEGLRKSREELQQKVEERTREAELAYEKLNRKEKLAVIGQLAGSVGHELRNPLSVMQNAVYLLNGLALTHIHQDNKSMVSEYLGILETEIQNAHKIVSDLLDFSRITPGEPVYTEIKDIIHASLSGFRFPESIRLNVDIPAYLPKVKADVYRIRQVVNNLVSNALESVRENGIITIWAKQDENMILVCVQDTGPGISATETEKIFEPLFTTKAKGIGLGLSICKNIVESFGGRIHVESETGKWTRFWFSLPHEQ